MSMDHLNGSIDSGLIFFAKELADQVFLAVSGKDLIKEHLIVDLV